ncbi:MAG: TerB family tellurite resistance protein [Polyangiaceae bacterium]
MLSELDDKERLRLMKFVCSFAWADLEVQDEERLFVKKMMEKLDLSEADRRQVQTWLQVPPAAEEVDPGEIPVVHRQLFLKTIREVIAADKVLDPDEQENLDLLEQLLS